MELILIPVWYMDRDSGLESGTLLDPDMNLDLDVDSDLDSGSPVDPGMDFNSDLESGLNSDLDSGLEFGLKSVLDASAAVGFGLSSIPAMSRPGTGVVHT